MKARWREARTECLSWPACSAGRRRGGPRWAQLHCAASSREVPKRLITDQVQAADIVITMGCGDACPVYPGRRYLDWDLRDPAGLPLDQVRPIRDEIAKRVSLLHRELEP